MSAVFERRSVFVADLDTGEIATPGRDPIVVPAPRNARVVVRLHHHPLGTIDIDRLDTPVPPIERVRQIASRELRDRIEEHLAGDGVSGPVDDLGALVTDCAFDLAGEVPGTPLVTVAVSTMTNEAACVQCVERVLASSYTDLEVVVVDNAPDLGQTEKVLSARFGGRVRYVPESRRGLSRARNAGLARAEGECIVFIDDDVIVDEKWMSAIAHTFASDRAIACVTGPIVAAELESPAQALLEQYGGFNKGSRRQVFDLVDNRRDTALYPYDAGRFGSGANIAMRTDVARRLGGFDESLGAGTHTHGGEDIDMLRRVVASGHTLVYEPAALMWHQHRRSYRALEKQMFRYGIGFSATVTSWMFESPRTTLDILRVLPAGLRHVLHPKSDKNRRKTVSYPAMLTTLERIGIALGPLQYLRSRIASARMRSKK